jgi:serine protease Do
MNTSRMPYVLGIVIGIALGLAVLLVLTLRAPRPVQPVTPPGSDEEVGAALEPDSSSTVSHPRGNAIVTATQEVSPAVVSINSIRQDVPSYRSLDELLQSLFQGQMPGPTPSMGLGSGFLVDHRGYILTNYHVVEGGQEIVVSLSNGEHYAADLVEATQQHDLALLKLRGDVSGLPAVEFGDSDALEIGEWAIAIGSPFGYLLEDTSPTITVGVISAVHRDLRGDTYGRVGQAYYYDMIQTDAAINSGNSGGPLVNTRGEVIGMNTFLISDQQGGGSVGVSFAVPATRCRWIIEEVLEYGHLRQAYAGIEADLLTEYRVRLDPSVRQFPRGLLVRTVAPGSPADHAGLLPRDVIVAINGNSVVDNRSYVRSLYEARVGTKLVLTVWRQGRTFTTSLVLAEFEPEPSNP